MSQALNVQFKVLVPGEPDDEWVPVDTLLGRPEFLVGKYLSIDDLHCCCFQGGYFIEIDGAVWSDDGTVDEFWMTMSWFRALREILDGAATARLCPWEESIMQLTRVGDVLEMEDVTRPRVSVPLREFVVMIVEEGGKFARLIAELRGEIALRRAGGVSSEAAEKFAEMEGNFPDDIEQEIEALTVQL